MRPKRPPALQSDSERLAVDINDWQRYFAVRMISPFAGARLDPRASAPAAARELAHRQEVNARLNHAALQIALGRMHPKNRYRFAVTRHEPLQIAIVIGLKLALNNVNYGHDALQVIACERAIRPDTLPPSTPSKSLTSRRDR